MKRYCTLQAALLILLLVTASMALIAITDRYILTPGFYDRNGQSLSGIPATAPLLYQGIQRVIYLYAAMYLLIKILVISLILSTALYFFDLEIRFSRILRLVTAAEFIFLIPAAVKIAWFWQQRDTVTLEVWQDYYFLSLASLVHTTHPVLLYPLQLINIFELSYIIILADSIRGNAGCSMKVAFNVVCASYVPMLMIWVITVIFLALTYFPQSF